MADDTKDLAAIAAGLAARHGDATKALEKLVDENHDMREKNRALKAELKAAQETAASAKVPDGAVVLTKADAEAWAAYQALGAPRDVAAAVTERDTLKQTIADRDARAARQQAARAGAAALGWNADALATFADDRALRLEMREVEVDGVKKSVPHVLSGEGDAVTAEPLDVVAARDFAVYLPALTATPTPPAPNAPPVPRPAPTYPAQRGNGAPATGNAIDELIARNAERARAPNALRPAPASA